MVDLNGKRESRLIWLIGLVLTCGTLACYWPVRHFNFINLDDGLYVYKCLPVQQGLTWHGLIWAFQSVEGGNWNPLVWLSHMADCQLYGLKPGGHHLTNVLLHVANVGLLFLVLRRLTGTIWRSALVAAIFAWHPLHVESVAWVSERKDVLSTLFWLLTLWSYERYARELKVSGPRFKFYYGLTLLCLALGLMCKAMLVTLPAVLLLLDYWPLRRTESWWKRIVEKLPFVALSVVASALTVWAQKHAGAVG